MLQVLENTEGGTEGSLMASLDMCATVMGKRRLRAWLCRPMARIGDIVARQEAVADLMSASEAAQAARSTLSGSFPSLPQLLLKCCDLFCFADMTWHAC
jgi:DNA mismatch repair protein MSH6